MTILLALEEVERLFGPPQSEHYEHIFDRLLRSSRRSHHRAWRCGCYGVLEHARWKVICCEGHSLALRHRIAF